MKDDKIATSGNRKAFKYRGSKCLNCGQPLDLSDVYCPYCSQLNSTKQLSLKDFIAEFLSSIVNYDSRLRYTVKDLLFRPGVMTRNYVNGKRFRYANPFRFFLSVSIIYFLLNSFLGVFFSQEEDSFNNNFKDTDFFNNLSTSENDSLQQDTFALNKFVKLTKDTSEKNQFPVNIDSIVNDAIAKGKKIDSVKKSEKPEYVSQTALDTLNWGNRTFEKIDTYRNFYENTEIKNASKALDSLHHQNTRFNRWLYSKNKSFDEIAENPYGFINYMMSKIPFFLFFFTPVFALFFWLIYSKKRHSYIEHMIFIFHIFSFLFLSMLIVLIPEEIFNTQIFTGLLFLVIGPFYFYKALRNFYGQSRLVTLIKFVFLNNVFAIAATFSVLLFLLISAAVY